MSFTVNRPIRVAAIALLVVLAFALQMAAARIAPANAAPPFNRQPVVVYIVEHGEPVLTDPALPLSDNGIRWAKGVAQTLRDVPFTNAYASSALRSKQTISYTAADHGLPIVQLPNGDPSTPSAAAAAPIAQALQSLRPGSVALVGGNTENIYRIMNTLGIPVVAGCGENQRCVPCLDKTCFTAAALSTIWRLTYYGTPVSGTGSSAASGLQFGSLSPDQFQTGLQRIRPAVTNDWPSIPMK
jgi:phosphohistidine phosphatase SixA